MNERIPGINEYLEWMNRYSVQMIERMNEYLGIYDWEQMSVRMKERRNEGLFQYSRGYID